MADSGAIDLHPSTTASHQPRLSVSLSVRSSPSLSLHPFYHNVHFLSSSRVNILQTRARTYAYVGNPCVLCRFLQPQAIFFLKVYSFFVDYLSKMCYNILPNKHSLSPFGEERSTYELPTFCKCPRFLLGRARRRGHQDLSRSHSRRYHRYGERPSGTRRRYAYTHTRVSWRNPYLDDRHVCL